MTLIVTQGHSTLTGAKDILGMISAKASDIITAVRDYLRIT
jgi:hypothetical protein